MLLKGEWTQAPSPQLLLISVLFPALAPCKGHCPHTVDIPAYTSKLRLEALQAAPLGRPSSLGVYVLSEWSSFQRMAPRKRSAQIWEADSGCLGKELNSGHPECLWVQSVGQAEGGLTL